MSLAEKSRDTLITRLAAFQDFHRADERIASACEVVAAQLAERQTAAAHSDWASLLHSREKWDRESDELAKKVSAEFALLKRADGAEQVAASAGRIEAAKTFSNHDWNDGTRDIRLALAAHLFSAMFVAASAYLLLDVSRSTLAWESKVLFPSIFAFACINWLLVACGYTKALWRIIGSAIDIALRVLCHAILGLFR